MFWGGCQCSTPGGRPSTVCALLFFNPNSFQERVSVRRALLGQKMEEESSQFRQERQVLIWTLRMWNYLSPVCLKHNIRLLYDQIFVEESEWHSAIYFHRCHRSEFDCCTSGRQRRLTSLMRSPQGSDSGAANSPFIHVIIFKNCHIGAHWWGDTGCGTWVSDVAQALLFSFGPCPTFTPSDHYFQPFRSCPNFLSSLPLIFWIAPSIYYLAETL